MEIARLLCVRLITMDLVCHENLAIDTADLKHRQQQQQQHHLKICQHDDYMSSNSNSSSYSYSLSPPPSLSQYSISSSSSSTLSSGIGSLVGTEDSNFGDLTRSSSNCSLTGDHLNPHQHHHSSFASFRDTVRRQSSSSHHQYSPDVDDVLVHEEIVETTVVTTSSNSASDRTGIVQDEEETIERSHVSRSGATKRSQTQPVIFYNHSPKIRKADRDPVFLENRCLANLFELEAQLYPSTRGHMKGEINEQMRRIVAGWMMEVSDRSFVWAL